MDKYTQDLIACAKGEITIDELEIPESITPWTEEQINAEIERFKTNPNRADKLMDFKNFLGQERDNLQNYADEFILCTFQQGWNYSTGSQIGIMAEEKILSKTSQLLLKNLKSATTY